VVSQCAAECLAEGTG